MKSAEIGSNRQTRNTSYSGMILGGKYMSLREIGNALAGHNAKQAGKTFTEFQKISGALQVAGKMGALKAATLGTAYGEPPNFGEKDYQRMRSEYGYSLPQETVEGWLK